MSSYLDKTGLTYLWGKIKSVFAQKGDAVKNIERNGTTFTATKADGTTFTFDQQDSTVEKSSTTPLENGTAAVGSENQYAAGNHVHPHDSTKVDKVDGKGLSTNDFTTEEKSKLDALPTSAGLVASLNTKVDKVEGKGLSSNDFTSEYKEKLDDLPDVETLSETYEGKLYRVKNGNPITFTDGVGKKTIADLVIRIDPVQLGTGDPSSENVRPIIGWDRAVISRSAKNMLDPLTLYGGATYTMVVGTQYNIKKIATVPVDNGDGTFTLSFTSSWGQRAYVFDLIPGVSFRFSAVFSGNDVASSYGYLTADNVALTCGQHHATSVTRNITFIGTEQRRKGYVYFSSRVGNATVTITKPRLEIGTVSTEYEPYVGDICEIVFPVEVGTVYGGTLDVINGILTVDRAVIESYDGEVLPSDWISSMDVYSEEGVPTTGAQVVYRLDVPLVYQIPPTDITMLSGLNNIVCNTGEIVELRYANSEGWGLLNSIKPASQSLSGLMSAEDKEKLDSITPLRMNSGVLEYFDGSAWTAVPLGQ